MTTAKELKLRIKICEEQLHSVDTVIEMVKEHIKTVERQLVDLNDIAQKLRDKIEIKKTKLKT
jgi:predicted  nucleic acid-binding Zn-ribbon protein